MRLLFASVFLLFTATAPCAAGGSAIQFPVLKPIVKIHYDPGKIEYRYQDENIKCGEQSADGCTHTSWNNSIRISPFLYGQSEKEVPVVIDLFLGFKPFLIDVSTRHPMKSCRFDQVVKHELTHVALHRRTMEKYKKHMAAEMLAVVGDDAGLSLAEIKRRAHAGFFNVWKKYHEEDDRQQGLLDGPDHYAYQWKYCHEKAREKAREKMREQNKEISEKQKRIKENVEKGREERNLQRGMILQKFAKNEIEAGETSFNDEYGYRHKMTLKKSGGQAVCVEKIITDTGVFHETSVLPLSDDAGAMPFSEVRLPPFLTIRH